MIYIDGNPNSRIRKGLTPTVRCDKKKEKCILLAEDDDEMRALLAIIFHRAGYKVIGCPDGWSLLEHLESHILPGSKHENVDLVVSDIRMPGVTGIEILRGLPKGEGYPPIVLITAFGDEKTHDQAELFGVAAIFDKPFEMEDLLAKVREIIPI